MAGQQTLFCFILVISVVIECRMMYPIFTNNTDQFINLAVSENYVYIGGNGSVIQLDSKNLSMVNVTIMKEYPENWLLHITEEGKVLICNYKLFSSELTNCQYVFSSDKNTIKAFKVIPSMNRHIVSIIHGGDLFLGTSSCSYFENLGNSDKCIAIGQNEGADVASLNQPVKYIDYNKKTVNFLSTFKSTKFVYFLMKNGQLTKLGKICTKHHSNDQDKNSYEDTPIECSYKNTRYVDAVDSVVWQDYLFVAFMNGNEHIICKYDFTNIGETYMESRKERLNCTNVKIANDVFNRNWTPLCFENGICKSTGTSEQSEQRVPCPEITSKEDGFCQTTFFNSVEGYQPITSDTVIYHNNTNRNKIVKLGIQDLGTHGILYVGTSQGSVGKIFVSKYSEKEELIDGFLSIQPTFPVLDIKVRNDDVYVMTRNKVINIAKDQICTDTKNCSLCMQSNHTKCGWDIRSGECNTNPLNYTEFLPSLGRKCLKVIPSEQQVREGEAVALMVEFEPPVIPSNDSNLKCETKDGNPVTVKNKTCKLTNPTPGNVIHVDVLFHKKSVAYATIQIYRCSEFTSCYQCVKNKECYWLFDNFSCNHNGGGSDNVISPKNDEECPRITTSEVLIPIGKVQDIKLAVNNISLIQNSGTNLECLVKSKKYVLSINSAEVVCQNVIGPESSTNVTIVFENKTGLDGSATLQVYQCRSFAMCGECNYKARNGYDCAWMGNKCKDKVETGNSGNNGNNGNSSGNNGNSNGNMKKCNDTVGIIEITPNTGPVLGGTKITIEGTNLGYEGEDISITIGDVPCLSISVVENSKKLTCITGNSSNDIQDKAVTVTVTVGEFKYTQANSFTYKNNHSVAEFKPDKTIQAGGRMIKIEGKNIHFPQNEYDIRFCKGLVTDVCLQCDYKKSSSKRNGRSDTIWCQVGGTDMNKINLTHIYVTIDNKTVVRKEKNFSVVGNPSIKQPVEKITIFKSGGSKFNISGTGFGDVDVIRVDGVDGNCIISKDNTSATCEAPPKIESDIGRRRKRSIGQNLGLHFDNFYNSELTVYYKEDPYISSFGAVQYQAGSLLVIEGLGLRAGAKQEDYHIKIGLDGRCNIEQLTDSNITCLPPKNVPRTNHSNENTVYVIVKVGRIERHVGYLVYEQEINILAIIVGSLAGAILLAVGFGALLVFRFKKKKDLAEKEFEMKLSTMEQRIRETSREEFADAQMTIKDIKSDLVTSKVPYHDYQTFVFNHLFPNQDIATHPLLHQPMVTDDNRKNVEQAMDMFGKLLTNKMFLRALVRTLDSNVNTLTMKDKAQFSSLLSVAFIGNMRLFYQLISCLLEDMIKQANKKQHKVLFRRFESITQRLTVNWLVMSLYDHIKTNGGMQLFMLYKATQTVVEKGPIDAVNLSCKYTLAEERLLKTRVDCETMKLAIDLNGNGDTTIPVEVLDCDTISQVKHKCCSAIYRNKPASEIPKTEDLELEWHAGKGGKLTLQDVDNISDRSNGMLRLNTLKHYLVKDGSVMALMYKDTTDEPDDMYENYGQGQPGSPASPDHIKLLIPSENHSDMHKWHLSNLTDEEKSNNEHEIGEIFLNRLFHTKLVLKEYIDVAFEGVVDPQSLSEPVRYFLCMLDKQGKDVGVDSDVLQNWKSECYATRVWASMIAKPQLLFDVDVPTHVEPCMDILKQVFIDSFTQNPQNVTKEASTQKLLFCKDIPIYRKLVNSFFMKVEPVNDQQFWRVLDDISNNQTQELKFSRQAILHQLYKFIFRYREKILDAFEDDEECKNLDFARKLENVTELMEEA